MEVLGIFTNNIVIVLSLIGVLAFLVSVITEVTKNIGFLEQIPTDMQVIFMSIVLCQWLYFTYVSYMGIGIRWFYIVGCLIAAFIVSFVAMYGWDKLTTLYYRFKK